MDTFINSVVGTSHLSSYSRVRTYVLLATTY